MREVRGQTVCNGPTFANGAGVQVGFGPRPEDSWMMTEGRPEWYA